VLRRRLATYCFRHLMELALVLALRVYRVVPESVLVESSGIGARFAACTDVRTPSGYLD